METQEKKKSPQTHVGKLEYDLTDPDAVRDFKRAVKSLDLILAIWDWNEHMRLIYRSKIERKDIEGEHEEWLNVLSRYSIDLDELVI